MINEIREIKKWTKIIFKILQELTFERINILFIFMLISEWNPNACIKPSDEAEDFMC